jgi:DNA/RNA-binding domain of Phe-tRNA-synthetase-like protein
MSFLPPCGKAVTRFLQEKKHDIIHLGMMKGLNGLRMSEKHRMKLLVEPGLSRKVRLGCCIQKGIKVTRDRGESLNEAIEDTQKEMISLYGRFQPSEIPGLKPARRLFRSIGVDPTRMRPASEALLRRTLKGKGIPVINSAVDAANLISLRYLVPVGLYDFDKIQGDVLLRLGRDGESYQRIGSGILNLNARMGLFDKEGGFGNPTGDSRRTSVTCDTKNLLFVAFFPRDQDPEDIHGMIEDAGQILSSFTGGLPRSLDPLETDENSNE